MDDARRRVNARFQKEYYRDYALIFLVIFLLAFGLVVLYSASAYESNLESGDSTVYLRHQAVAMAAGLFAMFLISHFPDYHFYEKLAVPAYVASIVLILLIIPFGTVRNGAKRWIYIGGVSVQPAEIAKAAMIIFLATFITKLGRGVATKRGFWMILAMPLPVCALVYLVTSNLSSAIIIFGIAFVMLFIAAPDYRRFVLIVLGVLALATIVVVGIVYLSHSEDTDIASTSFRFARILAWLNPEAYAGGKGYQTLQSLYAIGSGGIFGKGLGESMQKIFIPEAQNDMIFAIVCEELGLFGGFCLIMMFVLLLWRMMIIANNAPDMYGALIVIGVMAHISIQVILNIAVVTNSIPNTGITLPFFSYGGSAVAVQLAEIGMVLNVSRRIQL